MQALTMPHEQDGRDADDTVGRQLEQQGSVLEGGAEGVMVQSYCT